jgi:hypothetical protein
MTHNILISALAHALFFSAPALRAAELSTAAPAGIESAIKTSTAAAPAAVQTPAAPTLQAEQAGAILGALKHLSALLSKGALLDRKELSAVLAETAALDVRIKNLLGPAIMEELAEREKERLAEEEMLRLRSLLIAYYGDNEGVYPAAPEALIPKYLAAIPELELPHHNRTGAVELNAGTGAEIESAVTDSGGWLYFTNPASVHFGMLILNCSHKTKNDNEFYKR